MSNDNRNKVVIYDTPLDNSIAAQDKQTKDGNIKKVLYKTVVMNPFASRLPNSPVSPAFAGLQWDPLEKLRLSKEEKLLLRSAEANPLEYTLCDPQDATAYARVLLKVLAEASGPSGPSSKVSHLKEDLLHEEALQMLYLDAMGVVTHYAITKLSEVIISLSEKKPSADVTIATTFYMDDGVLIDEWRPLLRVLHLGGSGDPFAQRGASLCLSYILIAGCPSQRKGSKALSYASAEEPLQALISWITSQLQSSASSSLSLVTPTLVNLVNCAEARLIFATSGGIGYLSRHIRVKNMQPKNKRQGAVSVQQLYELCFCLWTITYECNTSATVRTSFARDSVVQSLVDIVTSAPREKIVRVTLSALRNLAVCEEFGGKSNYKTIDGPIFLNEMIGAGLMKQIDLMRERQWTDPDLVEDLDVLHKLLHDNYKDMSTWDLYAAEVESGALSWGILHTEKFFRENARRMEGPNGNFSILKLLILHAGSMDDDICAIACFDLGEFVRHYPNGRSIAKKLGAKEVAMKLIEHDSMEVQRHALQCVSKMMVQNWAAVH